MTETGGVIQNPNNRINQLHFTHFPVMQFIIHQALGLTIETFGNFRVYQTKQFTFVSFYWFSCVDVLPPF